MTSRQLSSFIPLMAGAGSLFRVGVFLAASIISEEEEQEEWERSIAAAAEVIARSLLEFCSRCRSRPIEATEQPVKRRVIFWDRERARSCIQSERL